MYKFASRVLEKVSASVSNKILDKD
jgi:hypothetical protein